MGLNSSDSSLDWVTGAYQSWGCTKNCAQKTPKRSLNRSVRSNFTVWGIPSKMCFPHQKIQSTSSPLPGNWLSLSRTLTLLPAAERMNRRYQATFSPVFGMKGAGLKIMVAEPLCRRMGGGGTSCTTATAFSLLWDATRWSCWTARSNSAQASYDENDECISSKRLILVQIIWYIYQNQSINHVVSNQFSQKRTQ